MKTVVNIFSQKRRWAGVASIEGVPEAYKEGGSFINAKSVLPWQA
jgi:hypothetical protein